MDQQMISWCSEFHLSQQGLHDNELNDQDASETIPGANQSHCNCSVRNDNHLPRNLKEEYNYKWLHRDKPNAINQTLW